VTCDEYHGAYTDGIITEVDTRARAC